MKKIIYTMIVLFTITACQGTTDKKKTEVQAAETPDQDEWISLFDGETFNGWHLYNGADISEEWQIIDGAMVFDPEGVRTYGNGGKNIVSNEEFTNFQLSIEWNISEAGNSGIFWGVQEGEEFGEPYLTGPEIQVLDNERHPDAQANPKFHQAGALYDIVQPTYDVCNPAGEWNHVLLTIDHNANKGSVELNGTEIVTFPVNGPEWEALVAKSKFGNTEAYNYTHAPKFGQFKTGKIGLQDHGDRVAYRNIKIRKL